jgi:hypothetical protein
MNIWDSIQARRGEKMSTMEMNIVMLRKNAWSKELADVIQKSRVSFDKKRFGHIPFDIKEVRALATAL